MAARTVKVYCWVLEGISTRSRSDRTILYVPIIFCDDIVAVPLPLARLRTELIRPGIALFEPCKVAARGIVVGRGAAGHGSIWSCNKVALIVSALVAQVTVEARRGLVRTSQKIRPCLVLGKICCHLLAFK